MVLPRIDTPAKELFGRKNELFDRDEAAEFIGLSASTLSQWAGKRINLPYLKCGRRVKYLRSDLLDFLERQRVLPGAS